jgi:parallel beta-helix repeat protein
MRNVSFLLFAALALLLFPVTGPPTEASATGCDPTHEGVKCIRDDATGGDCTLIGSWDLVTKTCTLTQDVAGGRWGIQIDEDEITLDGNGHSVTGIVGWGVEGVGIYHGWESYEVGVSNVTVKNLNIEGFDYGILVLHSSNSTVDGSIISEVAVGIELGFSTGNTVRNNAVSNSAYQGIALGLSSNNTVIGNMISNNWYGLYLFSGSLNNLIINNTISNNSGDGILLDYSNSNQIYNNNFIGNYVQARDDNGAGNVFNLAAPTGGNYWSDWTSPDSNHDGFVDNPFNFGGGTDYLPRVRPAGPTAWRLPFGVREQWRFTCGPHPWSGCGTLAGTFSALDFAPPDRVSCYDDHGARISPPPVSDGRVLPVAEGCVDSVGEDVSDPYYSCVEVDHGRGWHTRYCHLATESLTVGQHVYPWTLLGYASCRLPPGGGATGAHVHFALEYEPGTPQPCPQPTPHATPVPIAGAITLCGWEIEPTPNAGGRLLRGTGSEQESASVNQTASCVGANGPTLLDAAVSILQGHTEDIVIFVPGLVTVLTPLIAWGDSTVNAWLTAPDGTIIDPSTAGVFHTKGGSFEYYEIASPQSGNWTLHVYGADVPSEGEDVSVIVSSKLAAPVGGIADLPDVSVSSSSNYVPPAALAAVALLALTAGAWYARRRGLR